jgi:hypothetical protein
MEEKDAMKKRLFVSLVRNLSNPDDDLRLTAVESLLMSTWDPEWRPVEIIDAGALAPLVSCLSDDVDLIRGASARLLGVIVERGEYDAVVEAGSVRPLERLLDDPDPLVRSNARHTLEAMKLKKCA